MKLLFLSSCFAITTITIAYKIVIFTPGVSNSQINANKRVAEVLADAGHDVHLVILNYFEGFDVFVTVQPNVKVKYINASVGIQLSELKRIQAPLIFHDVPLWDYRQRELYQIMVSTLSAGCRQTLRNKEFIQWLKDEKFDIAFPHFVSLCHIGLTKVANIPTWIWLNSAEIADWISYIIGNPIIPSYMPPVMMQALDEMTFFERTKSLIGHGLMKTLWPRGTPAAENQIFREEVGPSFPDLMELAAQTPLVIALSNVLYELPRPTLAKVVNVGGLGIQHKDAHPLKGQYAKIAKEAKGIIVFSFGSIVSAHEMPIEMKDAFLEAFRELPDYHFFMRYEANDLDDRTPPNLHLSNWLPQTDLLAHNKTIAFITHCGSNSIQESLTSGVPIIALPLFGDQFKNAMMVKRHGFSVLLSKTNVTKESIKDAIYEIINNPEYKRRVLRMSAMVNKQPISPETLLVKWTEFVAEFKTLENLVPAGQKLNFVQYHSIDVLAFLLATTLMIVYIIYKISKFLIYHIIYRKIFSKKTKSE